VRAKIVPPWMAEEIARQERLAWKPTPAAFEAFKVRDLELAQANVLILKKGGWDSDPEGTLHNLLTFGRAKNKVTNA